MIPRFVGHERYAGAIAGQALAHLYGATRLYVNYFQPSFQLLTKSRNGGSVTKRYSKPATPCDRLLDRGDVSEEMKSRLRQNRAALDPVAPLHSIRKSQAALRALSAPGTANASGGRVSRASCPSCLICGDEARCDQHTLRRAGSINHECLTHGGRGRTR